MHPKAKELKQRLIDEDDRHVFIEGEPHYCEGLLFVDHECSDGLHMNEVLFPKVVFMKIAGRLKKYFWDEINCHLCCGDFHFDYGHSTEWREFFYDLQCERFGDQVVDDYIANAPLKIRRRK